MTTRSKTIGLLGMGIALLAVLAALPGLLGGPIYDDLGMLGHPLMDGMDDVWAVFSRDSSAYLADLEANEVRGLATWRPLPMLSLIAVNAAFGVNMLVHHLVSFGFHLAAVALLAVAVRRRERATLGGLALLIFALHPMQAEAVIWVNGRSDAMAGVALLALHLALERRRWPLVVLAMVAGLMCKSTFLLPAGALAIAAQWSPDAPPTRAVAGKGLAALALALATIIGLRAVLLSSPASGVPSADFGALFAALPAVLGAATESLLLPTPRAMALLEWRVATASGVTWVFAAIPALALVFLAATRRWRALFLVGGAVATVLPAVFIAQHFWMGLDRYLYMPAALLAIAALDVHLTTPPRLINLVTGVCAVALAGSSFITATGYASQPEFALNMTEMRPEDPTGWVLAARHVEGLDPASRTALAQQLARFEVAPPSLAHHLATTLLDLGQPRAALRIIETAFAKAPGHLGLSLDLIGARAQQGQWAAVVTLARGVDRSAAHLAAVRRQLAPWLQAQKVPAPYDVQLRETLGTPNR